MIIYAVRSINSLKDIEESKNSFYMIDVNSWLEDNGFTHSEMNSVREWIFVEWVNKKLSSYYSKKTKETHICLLFSESSEFFIKNLGNNLKDHFNRENLDLIYIE